MKWLKDLIPTSPLLTGYVRQHHLKAGWEAACATAGLSTPGRRTPVTPRLSDVQILGETGNTIQAIVDTSNIGRTARYFEERFDILLAIFKAYTGRVERLNPSQVRFTIEWEPPLPSPSPSPSTTNTTVDISPLRIDMDKARDGRALLSLTTSALVGGQTEAGKSNLIWHFLSEMNQHKIPYRLSIIDPAGGVELNDLQSSPNTKRYVDRAIDAERIVTAFRDDMNARLDWMKSEHIRTHIPDQSRPLEILVIDELLLCADQLKGGAISPIGETLSVGRKARFIVWGLTQLGQKGVIGDIRDLFPQRICLRTKSQENTDAVLGTGATGEGAVCHRINRPGEGYIWTDQSGTYQNFRAPLIEETESIAQGGVAAPIFVLNSRSRKELGSRHLDKTAHRGEAHRGEGAGTGTGVTFLYKLYDQLPNLTNNNNPDPCYIGISNNPRRRFREHQNAWPSNEWASIIPQRTEIIKYPSRQEALIEELHLIKKLSPKYNVMGRK